MKKNITIISLASSFKKHIAKKLADELEMIFADVNELMEYNLINDEMLAVAGQEYFDKNERKTLQTIASYENTILTVDFSTLNKSNNIDILKQNSLIIYLALNFEDLQNINKNELDKSQIKLSDIAFKDRNLLLKNYADIIIDVDSLDLSKVIDKILAEITKIYDK